MTRRERILILGCLIVLLSLLIAPQLRHNDFDQYWAGARIAVHHGDPYNPSALDAVEKAAGLSGRRVIMFMTPPWTVPLLAPLGLFSYPVAHALWFALSLTLLLLSVELLWKRYGGWDVPSWAPLVLACTFVPNLSALIDGQILALILFSLTAFLVLHKTRHQVLTGLSLLGLGIKPHLTYLVAVAAAIWLFRQRRWTALLSCGLGLVSLCAITWAIAPSAFSGYRAAGAETTLVVSGFGGLLRWIFGMQHYWLQFTPMILGSLWFAWYSRRLLDWDWDRHLPVLLLASVTTSAYGWWYDQSLLTVALVPAVLAWSKASSPAKWWLLAAYLGVVAMQAATPMFSLGILFYIWTGPALAWLYFMVMRQAIE